ncbi:hypothetical protein PtA15_1A600 [Puccinia triticina]|uniref:Uncharacterized protein n=1 Tax=Puccinia triticina TaxID=208348 RepID=A0ABY7CBK6_9BASI|nr:uncharacterized protein PtA15_1A600 [Puccinia triticina]WAQ81260.1 hypothetical protein PtA15_1A600 [Puccinia triticina]
MARQNQAVPAKSDPPFPTAACINEVQYIFFCVRQLTDQEHVLFGAEDLRVAIKAPLVPGRHMYRYRYCNNVEISNSVATQAYCCLLTETWSTHQTGVSFKPRSDLEPIVQLL